ncbi:hypothetical protein NDK47_09640 [Brevibacillus ruminantium]|uniref:Uncharacterized protein n=1 Tax=Brevibacillus ruminantium TaxID=2950604 RepID=A0ABY4WN03_9BACL|nr:hypothetical protein [Brevibacillus ruminantium]USG67508.1 hypothetical protein NDK47_09640 [Brevibacillus ruminantium]
MTDGKELEYCNLAVWFDRKTLHAMMHALVDTGAIVTWKETQEQFSFLVCNQENRSEWRLDRVNGFYKWQQPDCSLQDTRMALVLYRFIQRAKGHVIVKMIHDSGVLVKHIRYGEAVKIVEIKGAEKKVIYEKACSVTMDQVIAALKRRDAEERIPVLRLELDYELATLYDALQAKDTVQVRRSTERLKQLRKEMLLLEA